MLALRAVRPRCGGACLAATSAAPSTSASAAAFSTTRASGMPSEVKRRKPKHVQGMTPQKRKALERAKQFAAGVKKSTAEVQAASEAARSTRQSVASVDFLPSLEELEALRPRGIARPNKGNYAKKHQALFDAIDQAFVRAQLVTLAQEFKDEDGKSAPVHTGRDSKATIIQRIMDRWGWVVPKPQTVSEPRTQEFPISAPELFLIQRDAAVAKWLESFDNLKVSVVPVPTESAWRYLFTATSDPETLGEIERFLHFRKERYARVEWTDTEMQGFKPTLATLWSISNVTGAYIEVTPQGRYIATGPSVSDAQRARGIAVTAAARATAPLPPLSAALPPQAPGSPEDVFALTPHMPSMSSPLPWDTAAVTAGRPLFRLTRSSGAERPGEREAAQRVAHMDVAEVMPLGTPSSQKLFEVVDSALKGTKGVSGSTKSVAVQFGHLLSPSDGGSVLAPPIRDAHSLTDKQAWTTLPPPVFSPTVPPSLIQEPLPTPISRVRKVTYRRAGANDRLVVSYAYPRELDEIEPIQSGADGESKAEPSWVQRLNEMLSAPPPAEAKRGADDDFEMDMGGLRSLIGDDKSALSSTREPSPLSLSFSVSTESTSDILLPDRPVDARILTKATRALPQDEVPAELAAFFADVHSVPAAAKVSLSDLATLRKGTGPEAIVPQPAKDESFEDDDMAFWRSSDVDEFDEFGPSEREQNATEPEAKADDKPPEPRIAPPPTPTEGDVLAPPLSVLYAHETFYLEKDEVMDVVEVTRRPEVHFFTDKTAVLSASAPARPPPSLLSKVTTRTVAAVDLRGPGGVTRFAELEAPEAMVDALYAELANTSREVVLGTSE